VVIAKQPIRMCIRQQHKIGESTVQLTRALDVHEVRVRGLHEALELVRALLGLGERVEEVNGERLDVRSTSKATSGWGFFLEGGREGLVSVHRAS
jgi:hypothetical protein